MLRRHYKKSATVAALLAATSFSVFATDNQPSDTQNITNIIINNIQEDKGLELGTNARARGTGSIATGSGSLALGNNAVATGGNETKDTIKDKLNENKQKLQEIADAEKRTNDLLNEVQKIRKVEADVIEAGERVKQVRRAKATAYDVWQQKQKAYNAKVANSAAFLKEYQAKIDDLNSRLQGVSKISNVNISSDDGLTNAATQLKSIAEEGTTLNLSVDFYKDYVSSYYKALGDLRQNEILYRKKMASYEFSTTRNNGQLEVINPYSSESSGGRSIDGVDSRGYALLITGRSRLNKNAFNSDSTITSPVVDLNFINFTTEVVNSDTYNNAQVAAPQFKEAYKLYFEHNNDKFLTTSDKEKLSERFNALVDIYLKSYEIAYYQYEYEQSKQTTWLDKKKEALDQYDNLINEFETNYTFISIPYLKRSHMDEWYKDNVRDIEKKNKITTDTLTSELQKALGINKDAIKQKEAEIEALKKAAEQAKNTYNNTNPSAADIALSQRYEEIMRQLTAKANKLKASQERLEALKEALTLNDLTDVGENAMAIGTNALTTGSNAIGIGTDVIVTGEDAIAIGHGSSVTGNKSIAIGTGHIVIGDHAGTFGDPNSIYGDNSYGIGNNITIGSSSTTHTVGTNTFVLGNNVNTTANNAVILGADSTGMENTVSVGSKGNERKIINVGQGEVSKTSTDAINGSQLQGVKDDLLTEINKKGAAIKVINGTNTTVTAGTEGNITTYAVNVSNDAIKGAVQNDFNGKADVDAGNITGTNIGKWQEKLGTGTNTQNDKGLITGDTLYNTTKNLANKDLSNITENGQTVIKNLAGEAVKVKKGTYTTVTTETANGTTTYTIDMDTSAIKGALQGDFDGKANTDASNLTADNVTKWQEKLGNGINAENNKGLITGDTLYNATKDLAKNDLSNITDAGKTTIKNLAGEAVKVKQGTNITVSSETKDGTTTYTINAIGNGKVEKGNTGLVTGDTVFNSIQNINNSITNKADTDLSNITNDGKTVIRNLAKGSVKVINGTNTTVTVGTDGDATTYTVNVSNDAIKGAIQPELDKKANTDASNLSVTDITKWQEKLGTGSITDGNKGLVTGDTIYQYTKNLTIGNNPLAVTYDNSDRSTIILQGENGTTITNLKNGELSPTSTDAVTGNQLYATNERITSNQQSIRQLQGEVGDVGAMAGALAALHPVDDNAKLSFSAGYGNYRGKNAAAIGAFYRPSEDVLFNVASTVTDHDNIFNAGVSFKVGSAPKRVKVDANEFNDMKKQLGDLQQLVSKLMDGNNHKGFKHERKGFKDVSSDHWAAEAVETLHANDVVQGYPDGEFKGDKTMTRYEYAQMLYNNEERQDESKQGV